MANEVLIESFAKVNLYLDVICKRLDGYHNIETIFQTISLSDILHVRLTSSDIEITCNNPAVPLDESNLACRAFLEFRYAAGYEGGVRIELEKNIPPGSGLGGGSSNAAATLVALNHLLENCLAPEQLHAIASGLGADVPFFLTGGLAAAWQIGDRILPLKQPEKSFLVGAVPGDLAVSTKHAYSLLQAPECKGYDPETISQCTERLQSHVKMLDSRKPLSEISASGLLPHNSLEQPVFLRHPEIGKLKEALVDAGVKGALMTGSGSAVYGLAASEQEAANIKDNLKIFPNYGCFVASTTARGWRLADNS